MLFAYIDLSSSQCCTAVPVARPEPAFDLQPLLGEDFAPSLMGKKREIGTTHNQATAEIAANSAGHRDIEISDNGSSSSRPIAG